MGKRLVRSSLQASLWGLNCLGFGWNRALAFSTAPSQFNHLAQSQELRNEFWALRHGQSLANVANIIASSPEIATTQYGLSDVGKGQAALAGDQVVERLKSQESKGTPYDGILLLSSDLLRARETAEAVHSAILKSALSDSIVYKQGVVLEERLRERGFGQWDGGPDSNYGEVWKDDVVDATHTIRGVESVVNVVDRTTRCIQEWDRTLENHMIICVAHGDVLQILQTAFAKIDPSLHRTLAHLETATLRKLPLVK